MKRILLAVLMLGAVTTEAQYSGRSGIRYTDQGSVFTVRRSRDWSQDRRDGTCRIRVRIDDDSDVELRGDQLRIRVLRGGPGRDEGSECNAPLPVSGEIRDFRFRGIDGRGNPRLVQEPSRRNYYVAVVNVQDPKGGDGGYTFELSWNSDGSGSGGGGGFYPERPTRPYPPSGGSGGIFDPQNPGSGGGGQGYLRDMDTSLAGSGNLDDGTQQYRLTDVSVRVRGDECRIAMTTDRRQTLEMWGRVNRNNSSCDLRSSNRGDVNGEAQIYSSGNNVSGVNVSGTINGRRFRGDFRGR
ncbi:MAG TPA: hypothetical protein VEX68_28630 [Bryobacteraceae bacterium]|nr:hypothetical protein [Bryobacteraceae bacterium]